MLFTEYKPAEVEPKIIEYWEKHKVVDTLRKKNKVGKKFYFLQGPPYTSGRIHLGHAWNYALKDMVLRYKRSQGFNVWDRNGYDVHGLPTEHKVMAKFDLQTKEDILKLGLDKFVTECEDYAKKTALVMDKDFQRVGCSFNYDNPYMALQSDYIEGEWWLVQQAWKNKRLYLGHKVITWCGPCETALAKHECEYKNIKEESIFLKFSLTNQKINKNTNQKKEFFIIWTTTPWTIPFNLGIMVNPELDYVRAEVETDSGMEVWILAKALAGVVIGAVLGKGIKILEEFKGRKMEGWSYEHPFAKLMPEYTELKKDHKNTHTVLLSEEYVDTSAGSGLVHCAPGCGPEDQEVGKKYGLPAFNNLLEDGHFPKEMKKFGGLRAKFSDKKFIEALQETGALVATTEVEHEYPHCWRCHLPVIFRTTKQWFFKIEDLRQDMIAENKNVNWVPQTNGFDAWTANLKDNSITRQRYWGTPVPIWKCSSCEDIEVIGSVAQLKKKIKKDEKLPGNLHRPWIDTVEWECTKCKKGKLKRIPDILDVWIDAGTASWNCLNFPQKKNNLKELFPADLVLEATEQVRLWFSMLSICSQLSMGKNSYKNVYMHGMLRNIDGQKMSKSLGNVISPDEMITKNSADVLRYYMCQTNAGQDIKFSWDEATLKSRYLQILWNVHKLMLNLAQENKINPFKLDEKKVEKNLGMEERYIFSKLHSTIKKVTELFEEYRLDETIAPLETLYLELSRVYIQMIREKSSLGEEEEKEACIYAIKTVVFELIKMFQMITPFICEAIYLNFKDEFNLKENSISHYPWPKYEEKKINLELEKNMEIAQDIIAGALAAREKANLGLRWPIKEVVVETVKPEVKLAAEHLREIILKQTNAKKVSFVEQLPGVKLKAKPDYGKIGQAYGKLSSEIIAKLSMDSAETISQHLQKEGRYSFTISLGKEKKEVNISKDMMNFDREVPDLFKESQGRFALVYVNTKRTEELEAEGYLRELIRQIQALRKKAGLEKKNRINLTIEAEDKREEYLEKAVDELRLKVGAQDVDFAPLKAEGIEKKYLEEAEVKIKKEVIKVGLVKVK